MPKVSIIIPTYNRANLLPRAIRSALAQTHQDFEIIVIDDCSTDDTKRIVNECLKKDSRIQYIALEKNAGAANAINEAMKFVRGEFVAVLDSDDEWLPEKLEKQLSIFEQSKDEKIGLVGCDAFLYNFENRFLAEYKTKISEVGLPYLLSKNNILSNTSVMMPKYVIDKVGLRDTNFKICYDWDYWIRLINLGYEIKIIKEPLFKYYIHNQSLTRSSNTKEIIDEYKYFIQKYNPLYQTYKNYYSKLLHNIAIMNFFNRRYKDSLFYYWNASKKFPFQFETITGFIPYLVGRKLYSYIHRFILLWNKDYLSM